MYIFESRHDYMCILPRGGLVVRKMLCSQTGTFIEWLKFTRIVNSLCFLVCLFVCFFYHFVFCCVFIYAVSYDVALVTLVPALLSLESRADFRGFRGTRPCLQPRGKPEARCRGCFIFRRAFPMYYFPFVSFSVLT